MSNALWAFKYTKPTQTQNGTHQPLLTFNKNTHIGTHLEVNILTFTKVKLYSMINTISATFSYQWMLLIQSQFHLLYFMWWVGARLGMFQNRVGKLENQSELHLSSMP